VSAVPGPPGASGTAAGEGQTIKQLNLIRIVAIVDFLLLIPLLMNLVGIIHSDTMVSVIGPIHGIGFLILLYLCVKGAGEKRWGWWFPAIVVLTLGPIGSLYGEHRIRRQILARA
jgi:integral membrane protein